MKPQLEETYAPSIAIVMGIIGGLSILGGIILGVITWPGDPGSGYLWKTTAYIPAITWMFTGFVSGVVFFAFAAGLSYLHEAKEYSKAIAQKLFYEPGDVDEDKSL